ncbi:MAG: hypothetical protein COB08_011245 [Rhodobacteraceae bacterium]|nr:hypothetical protein [Paracoccaceae bacterium]
MKPLLPIVALLLTSTAASAELTPQDILESWGDYYARFGGAFNIGETEVTGTTTLYSNVTAEMNIAGNISRYFIGYISVQSNADGSVDITFSPESTSTISAETYGDKVEAHASYDLGTLSLHAEGSPENIQYSFSAPIITVQQSQSQSGLDISTTIAMQGIIGTLNSGTTNGLITQTGQTNMAFLSAKIAIESAEKQKTLVDYGSENVSISYDMSLPEMLNPASLQTMLFPEGAVFGMAVTTGAATTNVDQKTEGGTGRFSLTQSSGALTAAFAENALSYGITATGATLSLANTPAQPFDFTAGFSRFHWGITLPVRKSDTPAPFALALALEGLTVGPEIWAKVDPDTTLSQTPASFAFSINGTAKLFVDLFDQTAFTALRGAPFELRALSLSSLSLEFEGMGLTGAGDVTFNNDSIDPMSGMPEPSGVLDFSITGALGMLDKIGQLGLIEPMIIIGAKGALGMFATPNSGPDSFTSRIEFTDGGHISVNGQQVK